MNYLSVLFYVFSAVLLFAAFRVITARNPVHAALYLVLAFFQSSGIWMLRKDVKGQNVADQVRVRAKDRLEIVKVAPVKPAAPVKENSEENPS